MHYHKDALVNKKLGPALGGLIHVVLHGSVLFLLIFELVNTRSDTGLGNMQKPSPGV